jgi:hypothetical protein
VHGRADEQPGETITEPFCSLAAEPLVTRRSQDQSAADGQQISLLPPVLPTCLL